jgi:hypothetical protein
MTVYKQTRILCVLRVPTSNDDGRRTVISFEEAAIALLLLLIELRTPLLQSLSSGTTTFYPLLMLDIEGKAVRGGQAILRLLSMNGAGVLTNLPKQENT